MRKDLAHQSIAVVGYGITGRACARFLLSKDAKVCVLDKRDLSEELEATDLTSAILSETTELSHFDIVVLSPGVSPHQTCFKDYQKAGGCLIGDIELFAWFNRTPVIGVTGSNGKTTVTDMLGKVLQSAGLKVALAGNYGQGALDLLMQGHDYDYVVLELSSFQLEMTSSLQLRVATLLNVTEDHIDRHGSLESYRLAKQRIFSNADSLVFNLDEQSSFPDPQYKANTQLTISSGDTAADFYVNDKSELVFSSCVSGNATDIQKLLKVDEMLLKGKHNIVNALTVFAIAKIIGVDLRVAAASLKTYSGLEHRFELVLEHDGKRWINDSKATNVGACAAALACFDDNEYLVLIAGGDAKGADLSALKESLHNKVNELIVFGKDAEAFIALQPNALLVSTLSTAIAKAKELAETQPRATVLLSPACASIDMFKNYQERGAQFKEQVLSQVSPENVEGAVNG
ncbi:UDP-N-acetylmuramoyl-L-alanine--D-glutamate ligase [Glaciecola sp. MH2013]|uniref:UDP-N-acetylmuramoyl-L-alanine--D-glutamate ligase n=1 Tax=Glaciecola sp. MH2013 TaxID=2785524 RepID=UPI00189E7A46|nr:UDP-N-acetylmuramoyl-L-alanine--D-glutamate ligase [Glaciecola sp. MH2013]MBF7072042.1 UDP-N-acetylmuramoyl-L-alanine--D-glutamate ligase [Glaciecola sp. MH2013]